MSKSTKIIFLFAIIFIIAATTFAKSIQEIPKSIVQHRNEPAEDVKGACDDMECISECKKSKRNGGFCILETCICI